MVAHLNLHTTYDLLNSSLRINDVVKKAQNNHYDTLAITDTNVLYGFLNFMMLVLKPILNQFLE